MSNLISINDQDKKIVVMTLEAELKRLKKTTPAEHHETAVEYYRQGVIKTLKKLNPRGYY